MATFLRICGGIWFALGLYTCFDIGSKVDDPDVTGMASLMAFGMFILPGTFVYLWGRRMARRDAMDRALIDAIKKGKE